MFDHKYWLGGGEGLTHSHPPYVCVELNQHSVVLLSSFSAMPTRLDSSRKLERLLKVTCNFSTFLDAQGETIWESTTFGAMLNMHPLKGKTFACVSSWTFNMFCSGLKISVVASWLVRKNWQSQTPNKVKIRLLSPLLPPMQGCINSVRLFQTHIWS